MSTTPSTGKRGALVAVEGAPARAALQDPGGPGKRAAEDALLVLVREDDVGPERRHELAERRRSGRLDRAPGREIDADAGARRSGELDRPARGARDRLREEGVPGDVEVVALEPLGLKLVGPEVHGDPAIREHRPRTVALGEGDDDAVSRRLDRPAQLDAVVGEKLRREPPGRIGRPLAEPPGPTAELGDPGGDVRSLPAGRDGDPGGRVRVAGELALSPHDHVEHEIAEGDDPHLVRSSHGT